MKRDYKLDLIRVISMTLVIIIHVSNIYNRNIDNISFSSYTFAALYNTVARIAVPLFFMISGALLIPREDSNEKYVNRVKSIVLTLFSWSVIYLIWNVLVLDTSYKSLTLLIQTFFIPIKAHLWFLYAIIGIYLILPFVRKVFKNTSYEEEKLYIYLWMFFVGVVYLITLISSLFGVPISIQYPIPMIQEAYYLGYFVFGYVIYKNIDKINIENKYLILLFVTNLLFVFVPTIIISYIKGSYFQSLFAYRSIFYMLASGSFMVFILKNNIKDTTIKIISKIAPYSFGIYFVHAMLINILNNTKFYILHSTYGILMYSLLLFIISYIVVFIMKKSKIISKIL